MYVQGHLLVAGNPVCLMNLLGFGLHPNRYSWLHFMLYYYIVLLRTLQTFMMYLPVIVSLRKKSAHFPKYRNAQCYFMHWIFEQTHILAQVPGAHIPCWGTCIWKRESVIRGQVQDNFAKGTAAPQLAAALLLGTFFLPGGILLRYSEE